MLNLPKDLIFCIFNYLGYNDAETLSAINFTFLQLVKKYKWNDTITPIDYSLKIWRNKFPNAIGIKVSRSYELTDDECIYFKGIKYLNIGHQQTITDKAFENFKGIHTLNMNECDQ